MIEVTHRCKKEIDSPSCICVKEWLLYVKTDYEKQKRQSGSTVVKRYPQRRLDVFNKDSSANIVASNKREKAVILDTLRRKHLLSFFIRSTYCIEAFIIIGNTLWQKTYRNPARIIKHINENYGRFGYRRIQALLIKGGQHFWKKVRRIIL